MIKKYMLPLTGTVKKIKDGKASGKQDDPICVIPILEKQPFPASWSFTCSEPNIEQETMEITLDADEATHNWLLNEIKTVPKLHDLISKHNFKSLKREDKRK